MTLLLRGMPARVAGLTSQTADSAHRLIGSSHFRLVSANPRCSSVSGIREFVDAT